MELSAAPTTAPTAAAVVKGTGKGQFQRVDRTRKVNQPVVNAATTEVELEALRLLQGVPASVVQWWQYDEVVKNKPTVIRHFWVLVSKQDDDGVRTKHRLKNLVELRKWVADWRSQMHRALNGVPATPPQPVRESTNTDSLKGTNVIVSGVKFVQAMDRIRSEVCPCNTRKFYCSQACRCCLLCRTCAVSHACCVARVLCRTLAVSHACL